MILGVRVAVTRVAAGADGQPAPSRGRGTGPRRGRRAGARRATTSVATTTPISNVATPTPRPLAPHREPARGRCDADRSGGGRPDCGPRRPCSTPVTTRYARDRNSHSQSRRGGDRRRRRAMGAGGGQLETGPQRTERPEDDVVAVAPDEGQLARHPQSVLGGVLEVPPPDREDEEHGADDHRHQAGRHPVRRARAVDGHRRPRRCTRRGRSG